MLPKKKRLYVETFGCQMNVHDSRQIEILLEQQGYVAAASAETADVIIVNTCSIREKAAQKILSELGRYRFLKAQRPELRIGVGGCLAQQMGKTLFARAPHVDFIFGTHQIHAIPRLLEAAQSGGERSMRTDFLPTVPSLKFPAPPPQGALTAFVTIMQGCDNFCAYCVVPAVRGREESRPMADIVEEVRRLADAGVRDVTLLGQNVNSYGMKGKRREDFPTLLRRLGEVEGIDRIRFTTSHPRDLSDSLIDCFGDVKALCDHIHLAVQSGSNRILVRMNRAYTREHYLERVTALRRVCPGISITSDIIVGFPGEDEDDFQATLDLMDEIRFDNLFSFKYSERQGTAAIGFDGSVQEAVRRERLVRLQRHQETYTQAANAKRVGRVMPVLVEGLSKNSALDVSGRTRCNRIVNFPGTTELIGRVVPVRVTRAYLHSLRGEAEIA